MVLMSVHDDPDQKCGMDSLHRSAVVTFAPNGLRPHSQFWDQRRALVFRVQSRRAVTTGDRGRPMAADYSQEPGWWQAPDGKWKPPESHPRYQPEPSPILSWPNGPVDRLTASINSLFVWGKSLWGSARGDDGISYVAVAKAAVATPFVVAGILVLALVLALVFVWTKVPN